MKNNISIKKIQTVLRQIKKEALTKKIKTALVLTVTTQSFKEDLLLLPIRYLDHHICLPIKIKNNYTAIMLTKFFDGKVDVIFVDAENKLRSCKNIFDKIYQISKKSKIYPIKGNDFTADSAFALICILLGTPTNKKICVVGAGNIGSKIALKLLECGSNVLILNSTKNSSLRTANAINVLKPKECNGKAIPVIKKSTLSNLDAVIGFTRGIPAIKKDIVSSVKEGGIVLDGGSGTITSTGIEEAIRKKLKILRLDIRMGFISHAELILNTDKLISSVTGTKKIKGVRVVAGGVIGNKGDVIVDNIKHPKKILGVSDGKGNILRNFNRYAQSVRIVSRTIN